MNYLFILLTAIFAVSNSAPEGSFSVLRGMLIDKNTGKNLTAAEIKIKGEKKSFRTITDEYGAFKINYEPGKYDMSVSYMGQPDTLFQVELGPSEKDISLIIIPKFENISLEDLRRTAMARKAMHSDASGSGMMDDPSMPMYATVDVKAKSGGYSTEFGEAGGGEESPLKPYKEGEIIDGAVIDVPIPSGASSISFKKAAEISAGKLTSGEVNDFRKWEQWQDFASDELVANRREWDYYPSGRIVAQLETGSGLPAVGATVRLLDAQGLEIWRAVSDNTGKAELWSKMRDSLKASFGEPASIEASINGETVNYDNIKSFGQGVNFIKFNGGCSEIKRADILFAVDATGSMGDEIEYLKAELKDIIGKVAEKHKDIELNLGSVFYRDFRDDYLIKKFDFNRDVDSIQKFIDAQGADGGGDTPEAVENALQTALDNMSWSESSAGKILFLILDAPPHNNEINKDKMDILARKAALMGVRIVPVACSGVDKSTEYLMRALALATNGTYIFLTNHSGIGGDHIAPTTDKYDVEFLNALFVRVIDQFITAPACDAKAPIAGLDVADNVFNKNENRVEPKSAPALKCYPNPTDGELTIECAEDIEELYLADIAGKLVANFGRIPRGSRKLNLGEFPTGVYFLKYSVKGAWAVEKTFLQK